MENTQTIATLTANESVTWALDTHYEGVAANADAALMTLSSAGVLSWQSGSGRDYEGAVKSAAGNNNYRVRVIATDSAGNTTPQDLTVQVVDASEAPSFVAASFQGASSTPTEVNKAVALNDFQIACSDLNKAFTLVGSATNGRLNLGGY
ncbi:MAG: hypothetical protein FGM28_13955, partial [Limnohabitans sp.]|nr:hypothetical protein [Limnohabitans sp.]